MRSKPGHYGNSNMTQTLEMFSLAEHKDLTQPCSKWKNIVYTPTNPMLSDFEQWILFVKQVHTNMSIHYLSQLTLCTYRYVKIIIFLLYLRGILKGFSRCNNFLINIDPLASASLQA